MTRKRTTRVLGLATLALGLALLGLSCQGGTQIAARYHCPMHPTYVTDKPGDCPICGMRLVPIEEKAAPTTTPAFHCPMHPEVTADTPGRCPKCGMKLVAADDTGDHPTSHKSYTCPMHPDFITDDPSERCPLCGMKVIETAARDQMPERSTAVGPAGSPVSPPMPASGTRTPAPGPLPQNAGRRILYYRNPMDPTVTSPVPAKDSMGMDYVPVYADEVAPTKGSEPAGHAAVEISSEGVRLAGIQTAPAVEQRLGARVRTVGVVVPDEARIRHIHTKIPGWVERLFVNTTGQYVRIGEPILSIYSQELVASQEEYVKAREAATRFAASSIAEVRKGGEELVAAARRRLELFDVPEAFIRELETTGKARRSVTLDAPVAGYVTVKDVFEGQQVDPSLELFTVADLSRVWVEADFYENEAGLLRIGDEASVSLPYATGAPRHGRITFISPTLDAATRTLRVRFEFANPGTVLKPGMFANVELAGKGKAGIVVPDSALIDTGERHLVFVSRGGGLFEPRAVVVGLRSDGKALILSGVAAGEQVVVRANFLLDSESRLRALTNLPPAPETGPKAKGPAEATDVH